MEPEITIGILHGNVIFSFKTDRAGTGITEAIKIVRELVKKYGESLNVTSVGESIHRKDASVQRLAEDRSSITLDNLSMSKEVLEALQVKIRKVPYIDLVLLLLHFAPRALSYDDIMSLSKEIKKPVSYEWLNTEFHRSKYSGLVSPKKSPGQSNEFIR